MSSVRLRDTIERTGKAVGFMHSGASLESALAQASEGGSAESRAALQACLYTATRRAMAGNALLSRLCERLPAPAVKNILLVALSLLIEEPEKSYVTVSETISAVKKNPATARTAGFANAVLRRFVREREELLAALRKDETVRFNAPRWWIDRLRKELGVTEADAVMALEQSRPPLTLRVNARKTSVAEWTSLAEAAGFAVTAVGEDAVILTPAAPVSRIPGFSEGLVSVQDAGAQMAALMLSPQKGARVLDACAAPGGKTAHLLERFDIDLTALEVDSVRAERISENLSRLGLPACSVQVADAADVASWWDGAPFDCILLDAPCTASGIVRRHPDIPFLRRPGDIASLAKQQMALLEALWPLVNLGGKLLYVVCSVFEAEGESQIDAFLSRHKDCSIGKPTGTLPGRFALLPQQEDARAGFPLVHDGFYYALLQKEP